MPFQLKTSHSLLLLYKLLKENPLIIICTQIIMLILPLPLQSYVSLSLSLFYFAQIPQRSYLQIHFTLYCIVKTFQICFSLRSQKRNLKVATTANGSGYLEGRPAAGSAISLSLYLSHSARQPLHIQCQRRVMHHKFTLTLCRHVRYAGPFGAYMLSPPPPPPPLSTLLYFHYLCPRHSGSAAV